MDVVVHFETSTPSITFKRENESPRRKRAERRAKSCYDAMTSGQKRRLCLRKRREAIRELRGIQRRFWLTAVILVIQIINMGLLLHTAPAIRSYIQNLTNGGRGLESMAPGGERGDRGRDRGGGNEAQKDNSYRINNNRSTIAGIKADLFNLDQQLKAAILYKFVHNAISTDELQDLSNRILRLIQAKRILTPKEKPANDLCLATRNLVNDSALGTAILKLAQGNVVRAHDTPWSQLRCDTHEVLGE